MAFGIGAVGSSCRGVIAALIVASSGGACAASSGDPKTEHPVESEVRAAFAAAIERYPQPLRSRLNPIRLDRETDLGVPDDAPLMQRLMAQAAYAYFDARSDRVVILDAGVAQAARWTGGNVGGQAAAGLLSQLASGLDVPGRDVASRWPAFVEAVQAWDADPIAGATPPGDARVLDRFVSRGVGRALARPWEQAGSLDLEAQMIHELAHALQLSGRGSEVMARLEAWGRLSGWVRRDNGAPFDGYHGGFMRMEEPAVLGRLLLGGERGDALYTHSPAARFVNIYAAYDPREDYAESMRLFFEDPQRLLDIAPTKFLFINALGYHASLDTRQPGPLWVGPEEIIRNGWALRVQRGAAELLEGRDGIVLDPRTVVALLRTHRQVLTADGLPQRGVFEGSPADVPEAIASILTGEDFSVEIDGLVFGPTSESVEMLLSRAVERWYDDDLFARELGRIFSPDAADIETTFEELETQRQPDARAMAAARLLEQAWGIVPQRRYAEMLGREVQFLRDSDRDLLAEAVLLRSASARGGQSLRESISRHDPRALAHSYDEIELRAALVAALLAAGDAESAMHAAAHIEGRWWGRIRHIEALCSIAAASGRAELLDRAAAQITETEAGSLSEYLRRMIIESRNTLSEGEAGTEERP